MGFLKYWEANGTKILGTAQIGFAAFVGALALQTANPGSPVLVTPVEFAWLSIINVVLGVMTAKRGFSSTAKQDAIIEAKVAERADVPKTGEPG